LATVATRFVAEADVAASELLIVTFTRAAANDLRAKVRQRLADTVEALDHGGSGGSADVDALASFLAREDVGRRRARLRRALTEFDAATVTTIHGFAFQVRAALGAGSGAGHGDRLLPDHLPLLRAACTDVLANAAALVTDADALPKLDTLVRLANQVDGRPDLVLFPAEESAAAHPRLAVLSRLVDESIGLAGDRRRAMRTLSFDDILIRFRAALHDTVAASSAVRELASRYRVVLIDEFQDTDPVQWDIFSTLFGADDRSSSLVLVGDPKQSIYGFRGADVHTYRRAVDDDRTARRVLATNWRSDEALLDAVGALLTGTTFGAGIEFHEVQAAGDHREGRLRGPGGELRPALALQLAVGPGIRRYNERLTVPGARAAVFGDLTAKVRGLLDGATLPEEGDTAGRPVRPGDVAVLVPRHQDAVDVQSALRAANIPATVTRAGSVLESEAANQLRWVLHAMERPSDQARVRLAALSWFGGWSAADLAAAGADDPEGALLDLQTQLRSWADALATLPVAAVLAKLRSESGVLPRLLAEPDGDRHVTDLDHLAELLATAVGSGRSGPATLLDLLEDVPDPAVEGDTIVDVDDDPKARRLETDADAVQIMTTWMAKGLEFPIVALPMAWWQFSFVRPNEYLDPDTGQRVLDLTVDAKVDGVPDADAAGRRRDLIDHESDGEYLRLLYVALTRARHLNLVWWALTERSDTSALARVLFARRDGRIDPERFGQHRVSVPPDTDVRGSLAPLEEAANHRHPGALAIETIDVAEPVEPWHGAAPVDRGADLDVAPPPSFDRRYQRWSFSRMIDGEAVELADPADDSMGDSGAADESAGESGPVDDVAAADSADPALAATGTGVAGPAPTATPDGVNPMAALAGSAAFGNLVHRVLERTDWQAQDLGEALGEELDHSLARRPLELVELAATAVRDGAEATGSSPSGRARLVAGLQVALEADLGPQFAGRRLVDLGRTDRLAELTFDLRLGTAGGLPTTRRLGEVVRDGLAADDPFRPWADALAGGAHDLALAGNLTGSIDLVARVRDPSDGPRFVIVDYKTNALHRPGEVPSDGAYAPARLVAAMAEHGYPLQALLYSVALHRYLRWRMPGYEPARHLGGAAYLFLRGMDGGFTTEGSPRGVVAWPIPSALVLDLSDLLDGARVGAAA
jgi:exodeoxyribonuclease V beta subunit